jgi:two-component system, NtrC family, sensor kinase
MEIYAVLSIVSIILSIMLATLIHKRFPDGSFKNFIGLMLSVAIWSFFSLIELYMNTKNLKILCAKIFYVGVVVMPIFWFQYSLEYSNNRKLIKSRYLRMIWILPIITLVLVFTNEIHGLVWSNISSGKKFENGSILEYTKGFWFTIHTAYSYILLSAGLVVIISYLVKRKRLLVNIYIIIGVLVPFMVNILYLSNKLSLDFSSAAFSFSCVCFSWSTIIESIEISKKIESQMILNEKMAGIGLLSAGIAHEINNPLGFVSSNMGTLRKYSKKMHEMYFLYRDLIKKSELAIKEEFIEEYQKVDEYILKNKIEYIYGDLPEIIDEIGNGLERIEKIVKSLLGFSRDSTNEKVSEFDLNKSIRDTIVIANNEIKYYAKVELVLGEIPVINACSGEINQVILNLIVNAAHAIKEKGIIGEIKICTYYDKEYVHCEISDNGAGIKKEHAERIFEPFFTTKQIGVGTGLGLSITHDIIVNKHNGKIDVHSTVGEGTTFIIDLPY